MVSTGYRVEQKDDQLHRLYPQSYERLRRVRLQHKSSNPCVQAIVVRIRTMKSNGILRQGKTIPESSEVRWRFGKHCRASHETRPMNSVRAMARRPTTKRLTNQRDDARDHELRFGSEHVFQERCRAQGPTLRQTCILVAERQR